MRVSDPDNRDRLTGVATEAALVRFAAAALEAASPHGPPVCFIQIDVDGLAGIHEEQGAAVCDAVLLGLADCLGEGVRGHDLVGRSGNGFGICMPELTAAQARAAAQRLRLRVLANPVATGRGVLSVTCSIGFALSADAEAGVEWLVGRAREARHTAQCEGGDRVVAAGLL
jgi:diguanylate cyclase (GGDEF)-like protein